MQSEVTNRSHATSAAQAAAGHADASGHPTAAKRATTAATSKQVAQSVQAARYQATKAKCAVRGSLLLLAVELHLVAEVLLIEAVMHTGGSKIVIILHASVLALQACHTKAALNVQGVLSLGDRWTTAEETLPPL